MASLAWAALLATLPAAAAPFTFGSPAAAKPAPTPVPISFGATPARDAELLGRVGGGGNDIDFVEQLIIRGGRAPASIREVDPQSSDGQ